MEIEILNMDCLSYLVSKAFEKQGILQIDDVEIVYKDVGKFI